MEKSRAHYAGRQSGVGIDWFLSVTRMTVCCKASGIEVSYSRCKPGGALCYPSLLNEPYTCETEEKDLYGKPVTIRQTCCPDPYAPNDENPDAYFGRTLNVEGCPVLELTEPPPAVESDQRQEEAELDEELQSDAAQQYEGSTYNYLFENRRYLMEKARQGYYIDSSGNVIK